MMEPPFFQQYGNEITFQNSSDLMEKLSHIDCSVPKRTCGRRSFHTERYDLKFYLERLSEKHLLKFPSKVRKEESPDFILSNNKTITTALEVTEATTESFQTASTKQETEPKGTKLEPNPSFNLESSEKGDKKAQWKAIEEAMAKRGEKFRWEGWQGDSVEKEWVEIILKKAVNEKLGLISFKRNFHCISVIRGNRLLYDITNKYLTI